MPIEVNHIEAHLFYNYWRGTVTLKETFDAAELVSQQACEYGESFYVVVIDASKLVSMSLEVRSLLTAARMTKGMVAMIVYNPPAIGSMAIRLIRPLALMPIEITKEAETALSRARQLIAEYPSQHS